MAESNIDAKIDAALEGAKPKVTGSVISENGSSVVLKSGDAIIEIPMRHIASRTTKEGVTEISLTPDANILVGTVVSVKHGFIGDNVFGGLLPHVLADNCNCNCNCGGESRADVARAADLQRPFTGGARRSVT